MSNNISKYFCNITKNKHPKIFNLVKNKTDEIILLWEFSKREGAKKDHKKEADERLRDEV